MEPLKFTIDNIKDKYKCDVDPTQGKYLHEIYKNFANSLRDSFKKFNFSTRIANLKEVLKNNEAKLSKEERSNLELKVREIENEISDVNHFINFEYEDNYTLFLRLNFNYNDYNDITGALNIHKKIGNDLLEQQAKKIIKYEKNFIIIDDIINNIINNIN